TTGVTPFYANYRFTPEAYRPPCNSPNTDNTHILAEDMIQLQEELKRTKEYANRTRIKGLTLQEGDIVYLLQHSHNKKLLNIKINRPSDKLDFRKLRPFKILKKISKVNYELDLPENIRLKTAVFHILLLKKALVDKETGEPIIDEIIIQDIKEEYKIKKLEKESTLPNGKDIITTKTLRSQNKNSRETPRRFCGNFISRPINVVNGLGRAGNGRIRRQQGNLTSGLRFTFLALNPFQLF
ncbi:hypothetical protein MKX08_009593, partial [Trichoderma sp. CBMAI-0020]